MPRLELVRAESEPLTFRERLAIPAESCGEDVAGIDPVELAGVVEKASRGFLLEGEVSGSGRVRCGRCLKEVAFSFEEHLSLRLLPVTAAPHEEEVQLGKNDLEVRFYDAPELDLAELAAEQVQLAVPMKPLCSAGCQGLCPNCGADLNQGPCACPRTPDGRWAPLLEWRKRP